MSQIEVDKVIPQSGTALQVGESGDTITVPAGATFDASSGTLTLPDGSVTNAKLAGSIANNKLTNSSITINGASVALGGSTTIATGLSWQSTIVTASTLAAVSGNGYWINTTSNACTITLPANPSLGDEIVFVDYARKWGTNAITINTNSKNFQGNTSPNPVYNTDGQSVSIVYSDATQGWIPTVDDDVTLETPQTYSADFLVIAGGGAGGSGAHGGAGGAGGFRTASSVSITPGSTYTVTVGAGGTGVVNQGGSTQSGSDSSISGSGITTITSAGGGGGARGHNTVAAAGGSGGGGAPNNNNTGPGASGNTPSTNPSQGNDGGDGYTSGGGGPNYATGGGGGAGAVGGNGSSSAGGVGGAGASSSITGSAVTYAGGGGGSCYSDGGGPSGAGGSGGGGAGGGSGNTPGAGTVNTGSGGGGASGGSAKAGGNGGTGVVIISVPTAKYSGTTSGSPTVTTSGSNKIIQFNGSGSYTA